MIIDCVALTAVDPMIRHNAWPPRASFMAATRCGGLGARSNALIERPTIGLEIAAENTGGTLVQTTLA